MYSDGGVVVSEQNQNETTISTVEDRDSLEQNPAKSLKLKNSSCQDFFELFLTEMYLAMAGRN